ncbi:MAG: hypothetical protein EAZ20_12180 [Bacteroidetes bacterium]|nr:MAG: hypothetical protein EAZ20_12180 [Bacteroidota bacterium]
MITLLIIWIISTVWVLNLWRKNAKDLSLRQKRSQIFMVILPVLFLGNYLIMTNYKTISELNRFLLLISFCLVITPLNYFLVKILHKITLKIKK